MGKSTLMYVAGVSLILCVLGLTLTGRAIDSDTSATRHASYAQAKYIAQSAAEIFILQVRSDPSLRGTFTVASLLSGSATVTISDWTVGVPTVVRLKAVGVYGGVRSTVEARLNRTDFPTITAAVALSTGSTASITQSGGSLVDGNNYSLMRLLDPSKPAVAGIAVSNNGSLGNVTVGSATNVKGGHAIFPDLVVDAATPTMLSYVDSWLPKATVLAGNTFNSAGLLGTAAAPQISHITGSSAFNAGAVGYGILIVEGSAIFRAGSKFYGLVVIRGGGAATSMSVTGSGFIMGAVIVDGSSNTFLASGGGSVQYCWQAIDSYAKACGLGAGSKYAVASWNE